MLQKQHTKLEDCFILSPAVFSDSRGAFSETFNQARFNEVTGLDINFVQDNESISSKGVLRGLHLQTGKHAQTKLVRAVYGTVLDIAVDCRKDSATYGHYASAILSAENHKQILVPKGFAHGFYVLSDMAVIQYKCDNYYNKESEAGIIYNDIDLAIDWQLEGEPLLSEKDLILPSFKEAKL